MSMSWPPSSHKVIDRKLTPASLVTGREAMLGHMRELLCDFGITGAEVKSNGETLKTSIRRDGRIDQETANDDVTCSLAASSEQTQEQTNHEASSDIEAYIREKCEASWSLDIAAEVCKIIENDELSSQKLFWGKEEHGR